MSAWEDGNEDAAKLVKEAMLTSPGRAATLRNAIKEHKMCTSIRTYDEDEALSLFFELNLSRYG